MKNLLLLLTILILSNTNSFAQIEYDVHETSLEQLISISSLRCILPAGNISAPITDRMYTELSIYFTNETNPKTYFEHNRATLSGCDITALDQMATDASTMFGHVGATVTIIKGKAKEPRIVFGKCQRNYHEQIRIDLGNGIVLTSPHLGYLKEDIGCH